MASEEFKRKLTTIFSADVVDYSRLMGEDESATVKTLETYKGVIFSLSNSTEEGLWTQPETIYWLSLGAWSMLCSVL